MIRCSRFLSLTILFAIGTFSGASAAPPINKQALDLSRQIPKYPNKGSNYQKTEASFKTLLGLVNASNRSSRSSIRSLLNKSMDFREDIGTAQKTTTVNAILDAWEVCDAYGGFNKTGQFTGHATKGRYAGKKLVFQTIIPQEAAPDFASYIGNLQVVPAEQARKEGVKAVGSREAAYMRELKRIENEAAAFHSMVENAKSKVDGVGSDEGLEKEKYLLEVAKAGDMVKQKPRLRLQAQKKSSPTRANGNRYRVIFDIANLSQHPTEIDVECFIVGYTDNDNKPYQLKKETHKLQLRQMQEHVIDVWSHTESTFHKPLEVFDPEKSTRVYYRGYYLTAKFNDELIATVASDGRMAKVATGEYPAVPDIRGMGKKKR